MALGAFAQRVPGWSLRNPRQMGIGLPQLKWVFDAAYQIHSSGSDADESPPLMTGSGIRMR